jgi:dihydrofolate synthase/folylpolyglutamate synthase
MPKMFITIDEVYSWLFNQRKAQKRENLDRIKQASKMLGLDKPNYKIIHVAGTNGKGSTAVMIQKMLALTGKHVGLFVSPYVISFNERIEINDRYISNAEIMHYGDILYDFSKKYEEEYKDIIPFFELTLLMALMYYKDRNIDILVMEAGLGGLLDATNFLDKDLAIITNIDYDHMAQLGNTLEEIAYHKLGIAKENGTLLTAVDQSLIPYFKSYLDKINCKMIYVNPFIKDIKSSSVTTFTYKDNTYSVSLRGDYQAYNASLAIEAVKFIDKDYPKDFIDFALSKIFWPGRMEVVSDNPKIIIDGGHNIHAIKASTNALEKLKGKNKVKVLFTALYDKDYKAMISSLNHIASYYYFCGLDDLRATDPKEFIKYTMVPYDISRDFNEALDKAIPNLKSDEILFITGSLHFISQVREKYFNK